ncbi:hypothetical protein ACSYAD_22405 [Acaryochloris marina NIES-2412]|uniref:hypothetical protein n=1 Tax=Acaryochloris marina TaxID=155978 RepID=UPI00405A24BE
MRSTHRKQSCRESTTACISCSTSSREFPRTNQSRLPRSSADLRRRFQDLERNTKDLSQQENGTGVELESLTVSLDSSGQYWIAVKGTGKPFISKPFVQPEFCCEAALELEEMFDMFQVIELRPPDTMERIEEMVEFYLERERVLLARK